MCRSCCRRTFGLQFLVFNLLEDTGFYWVHWTLHNPRLFVRFHYLHHRYDPPFSLSGEIMHPVEFLCNVLVPLMAGPVLFAAFGGGTHGEYYVACILGSVAARAARGGATGESGSVLTHEFNVPCFAVCCSRLCRQ